MIYYMPQSSRRKKNRILEAIYCSGDSIVVVRAFHLRLITLCSTSVLQLPLLHPNTFRAVYLFIAIPKTKPKKMYRKSYVASLTTQHKPTTSMPSHLWIFVFSFFFSWFFFFLWIETETCCAQQWKCFRLVLSMTLFTRNQMLYQLIYPAAALNDMAACDDSADDNNGVMVFEQRHAKLNPFSVFGFMQSNDMANGRGDRGERENERERATLLNPNKLVCFTLLFFLHPRPFSVLPTRLVLFRLVFFFLLCNVRSLLHIKLTMHFHITWSPDVRVIGLFSIFSVGRPHKCGFHRKL